jgi:riboflavin kinase/FMN adenylyltransferase
VILDMEAVVGVHQPATVSLLTGPVEVRPDVPARVVAIGKFDGIHRAHQRILQVAVHGARQADARPAIFTFTPHPRYALTGDAAYARLLTPLTERARAAGLYGIEEAFAAVFDEAFRNQTAEAFVQHYLRPLGVCAAVVGYDFRLGRKGACGPDEFRDIAHRFGIRVEIVEHVDYGGEPVSSSRIRTHLAQGEAAAAALLLGRPYRLAGRVVHGDGRGREIGFRTANVALQEAFVLPQEGVYAADCVIADGRVQRAAVNIGRRPTIRSTTEVSIEAHLLDFDEDLYGQRIALDMLQWLRPEQRFASLPDLAAQLQRDAHAARLATLAPGGGLHPVEQACILREIIR